MVWAKHQVLHCHFASMSTAKFVNDRMSKPKPDVIPPAVFFIVPETNGPLCDVTALEEQHFTRPHTHILQYLYPRVCMECLCFPVWTNFVTVAQL